MTIILPPNAMTVTFTVKVATKQGEREFSANIMAQTNKLDEIQSLFMIVQGKVREEVEHFLRQQGIVDLNSGTDES